MMILYVTSKKLVYIVKGNANGDRTMEATLQAQRFNPSPNSNLNPNPNPNSNPNPSHYCIYAAHSTKCKS